MAEPTMFVRRASGLVRAWSVFDGFIYSFFSVNLITLGLFIFASAPYFPEGNLITAIIISTIFIIFEVIVYAMLVAIMPRAGGDYVWQSRILGGGIGFVLSITGWGLILWHWVPLYGTMFAYKVATPILGILGGWTNSSGLVNAAIWLTTRNGLFLCSLIVIVLASLYVGVGMKWYARIQKVCFFIGIAGIATMFLMLLANTNEAFITAFNTYSTKFFGAGGSNVYEGILAAAAADGYVPQPVTNLNIRGSLALIPLVVFFNMWANWGATLYGEVRGASEFKRNFASMFWGLVITGILGVIMMLLFAKTIGWEFYHAANYTFYEGTSPLAIFPYPGLLTSFLTNNPLLQLWLVVSLSAMFFGWCGTVFLSSTRVIFAAAFDRVLPEWITHVSAKTRAPINALICMAIPSTIVSALNSYMPGFETFTLDTTVVITICYVGTTIAAIILPFKDKELYNTSPVKHLNVFGVPLITFAGVIFLAFLAFNLFLWIVDSTYGVNNPVSAVYMLILYAIALAIYFVSKSIRSKQGIDLNMIHKSIPVE
ncbi:MAG TPA: APC family permease [Clostridia bacterium]|nr:APC family permease [Clostridia bacterium]